MRRAPLLVAGLVVLALAALGNAGLGAYHAGVEWGFWQGPTDCTGPIGNLGSAGDLLARLDTVKVVRCDEVQWRFLGLSLAGYNVLISLLMAAIAAWGVVSRAPLDLMVRRRVAPSRTMRRTPPSFETHRVRAPQDEAPNRRRRPAAVRTGGRCPASRW